jgi:hypothetical protein
MDTIVLAITVLSWQALAEPEAQGPPESTSQHSTHCKLADTSLMNTGGCKTESHKHVGIKSNV